MPGEEVIMPFRDLVFLLAPIPTGVCSWASAPSISPVKPSKTKRNLPAKPFRWAWMPGISSKAAGQGRFTTLLAVSGGYNFTLNGQYFDEAYQTNFKIGNGVFFHPGIAFRVNLWQNTGLMFDIGYLFNSASLTHVASGEKTRQLAWHNILLRGSFFF
jgi:hypothetical protein